jgi:hypothetical protein
LLQEPNYPFLKTISLSKAEPEHVILYFWSQHGFTSTYIKTRFEVIFWPRFKETNFTFCLFKFRYILYGQVFQGAEHLARKLSRFKSLKLMLVRLKWDKASWLGSIESPELYESSWIERLNCTFTRFGHTTVQLGLGQVPTLVEMKSLAHRIILQKNVGLSLDRSEFRIILDLLWLNFTLMAQKRKELSLSAWKLLHRISKPFAVKDSRNVHCQYCQILFR